MPTLSRFVEAALICLAPVTALAVEVEITTPHDAEVIWGQVEVRGTSVGATSVVVRIDNGPFQPVSGTDDWSFEFDATALSRSHHTVTVRARDAANEVATDRAFVIVNDQSPPVPDCPSLVVGAPLPYENAAAPAIVEFDSGSTVYVEIIGHSENRGYDDELQAMLDANPPGGLNYVVTNHWIGGHETWRWVTPGEDGYEAIEGILANQQGPTIALILTSNNESFPAQVPELSDPNYARFVAECEAMADHLYDEGNGVTMCYFSAHRMKPANLMPSYYENLAISDLLASAEQGGKAYLKAGPEQHDLHWCCYPTCYSFDYNHTNDEGDALMADAWFSFLQDEIAGSSAHVSGEWSTPSTLRIETAHPSPASTQVTLSLTVGSQRNVNLGVFDAEGRRVSRIELGLLPGGRHQATLAPEVVARLGSGSFWVRAEGDSGPGVRLTIVR